MSKSSDRSVDLAQSWISNADVWTAAVRGGGIESRRLVTDQSIVDAVLAQQPRRVLDLGCGEGWLVRALAKQGVGGVGVDGSPSLIEAAQSAGGGTFHVCTYSDLADGSRNIGNGFDVVCANFAILHEEVAALLRTLRQSLVPQGKIVIQTVHPWSVGGAYCDGWREEDFRNFEGLWQPMPWYFRTLGSWVTLLRECGYTIIDLVEPRHPIGQLPMSLLIIAESKRC
ncbi:hypothetical protein LCGC14_0824380 [marine sediment metagenome]|uniref:Methyltransferase domain-containing protein n=1 Tax=marine sediment metagenome TaxID=412755 RepID=A0A0F9S2N4_9ZZZZ